MIEMKRKNSDFSMGRFDFFKWSAPIYETPFEVVAALNRNDFFEKRIERIKCIGTATISGLEEHEIWQLVKKAGIPIKYEKGWLEKYPYLQNVMVDCKVTLCEPLQFVFSDGTSFEFLPLQNGGARFSIDSIPIDINDGINNSNINLDALVGEYIHGHSIEDCEEYVIHDKTENYDFSRCIIRGWYEEHPEESTKYRYVFELCGGVTIEIEIEDEAYYTVSFFQQGDCLQTTYNIANSCLHHLNQVFILPGYDKGGTFWIRPTYSNEEMISGNSLFKYRNCGISVTNNMIMECFSELLFKYYDDRIQDELYYDGDGFDEYGYNRFSRDCIKMMIMDIREAAELMSNDSDNSKLSDIKKHYREGVSMYTIDALIDYYTRFADKLEAMLEEWPDCDMISFNGP